jgi:hypothetical protein
MDWSHTLRKDDEEICVPQAALLWNPQGNRKRGRPKKVLGEDRLSKKWGKVGMNYGFWQLIGRSGKNS